MSNIINIAGVEVRRDESGRYSLNDLHRAAGEEARHKPGNWTALDQTKDLIAEIEIAGIPAIQSKQGLGTFVAKELVYAYAMWISAAFHLKVIRTFDAVATGQAQTQQADPMAVLNDPAAMRGLLLTYSEKVLALEDKITEQAPKVQVHDRIADAEGSLTIRESANTLRIPERKFVLWLQQNNWCYRRAGHKSLLGYSEKVKAGYLYLKQTPIRDMHTGEERLSEQVRITPLGLTVLARRLSKDGFPPVPPGMLPDGGANSYAALRG